MTKQTGISFVHTDGSSGKRYIVETVSAGLALFDYDGDGDIDIYFLNGAPLRGITAEVPPKNPLYRNDGGWKFTDVTDQAGVGDTGYGLGVAVGDYDNDGDPDIYLNNYGPNVLYRNNGDGTFTDVTEKAGVANGHQVGAGACFLDIDKDGDLDLYVANYVDFTYENHQIVRFNGYPAYVGPMNYHPTPDTLYRNDGDGTFTDVSAESGIAAHKGTGMGMVCADYDNDGDTDIFVGNDVAGNSIFENDGTGKFEEVGLLTGLAYDLGGTAQGTMGVDCGDYNNDGLLDFHATSYQRDLATLYKNLGDGSFEDVTRITGAGDGTLPYVTWGNGLVDFDNDGDRDIFIACGHLHDNVDLFDNVTSYHTRNILLENTRDEKFVNISDKCGDALAVKLSSRGAGFDDLDNDGDIDAVILNSRREPTILRNDSVNDNHWLQIRLRGVKTNRDGVGAHVTLVAGDPSATLGGTLTQTDEVHSGRGYQSHYGTRLHFGLGRHDRVDRIEVHWIGGGIDVLENVAVDQLLTITELVSPLAEPRQRVPRLSSLVHGETIDEERGTRDELSTVEALKRTELELANRLVEDYPGDPATLTLLANVHNNHGNRTEAVRCWERVVAMDPNNAAAYDSMARVALLKEEHANAALLWQKAMEIDPNMFGVRFRLAHALMGMGKTRQAVTTLKKDVEISPKASWSYYLLGELYTQLKEYERAKQSFEAAIQIRPDYTKAYYGLATVCMRLKQPNEARKFMDEFKRLKAQDINTDKGRRSTYDDLATIRPRVAETCNEAGRIYYMHGNMRKAEQLWRTAAATDPKNMACRTNLATLYQQNNSVLQALQICEQLRQLEPDNPTRHFNVGVLNMRLKRFEAAEKAFLKARELAPQQSGSYRMLAQLYLEMGRRAAEAMALARQAVQLEPNAENYFVLGAVYADGGNLADALAALRRAVELDPQNAKYQRIYRLFQKRVQKEN